jgi:tetratricopeptide (TPR) repeat protein
MFFYLPQIAIAEFNDCGDLKNAYGPYDYRTDKNKLGVVEQYHFTPKVEALKSGEHSYLGDDLDYVLRAFPNHPRALMAMARLAERDHSRQPQGAGYTVECYFKRAIRFRPEDATARMVYGSFLARQKKYPEAIEQLKAAEQSSDENANLHYNLGLVYFEVGKFDSALQHAHRAYQLGFELPGLRNKLKRAGKWKEVESLKPNLPSASPIEPDKAND